MNDLPDNASRPKKKYAFYRILGFIDNFIAIFFLFMILLFFAASGFRPSILLYLFIFLAVLIYTNLAAVFARHVMVRGNYLRTKLKDWIKVNGIVTLLYAGFMIIAIIYMLTNRAFIEKISEMYAGMEGITDEMIRQMIPMIKGVMYFFGGCMLLLVVHVIMTFRYLRQFNSYFRNEIERP